MLIVLTVMFSMSACADSKQPELMMERGDSSSAIVTTQGIEINPFAEFFEVTFIGSSLEDAFDEVMLEEKYNIDLITWPVSSYDREGLTNMLASGDIPDFAHMDYSPYDAAELFEQGLTRSINIEMYKKHFPFYYELMLQNEPTSFMHNNVRNEDGSLSNDFYGISYVVDNKWYYNVPLARLDWLERVGYGIDDDLLTPIVLTDDKLGKFTGQTFITGHMWTHEEMNDIFRAFTEDDPDNNGEDDTYGGILFDHSFRSHWVDLWWGQFGVISSDGSFMYKDSASGDIVPWYAYEGYRDYMAWAADMKNKGYLRTLPEGFESLAPQGSWYDNLLATWMTGKVGYFFCDRQYICRPDVPEYSNRQPPQSIWLNTDESATFVTWPALAGPQGLTPNNKWGTRRYNLDAFASGTYRTWNIGASVSDEKLARVLTMWNDANSTPLHDEFWSTVLYGIEGVHYKWTGEAWNSGMIRTDVTTIPPHYQRKGLFIGLFRPNPSPIVNEAMAQYNEIFYTEEWYKDYCIEPVKYLSATYMSTEMMQKYNEDWNNFSDEINTIINDFRSRSWNGQISNINTEWDQYLNQLYEAGLKKLIDDYFNNEEFKFYKTPDLSLD